MLNPVSIKQSYKGGITDTDRWRAFISKPGDVIVSTPPKCGTTWTTTIVSMLCMGKTDVIPTKQVQWVEATIVPIEETVETLAAQTHRRCIKSHTPSDGIPWFDDTTYIAVYRHPIDLFFSFRKHTQNTRDISPDHPHFLNPDESLKEYIEQDLDFENYDDSFLISVLQHYRSFVREPRPKNVMLLHYSDLLADARSAIRQIGKHMNLTVQPKFVDEIYEATKFSNMKADPVRFAPFADRGFWKDPNAFFDAGGTRKWDGELSKASLSLYRDYMAKLLSPAEIRWLENGDGND